MRESEKATSKPLLIFSNSNIERFIGFSTKMFYRSKNK